MIRDLICNVNETIISALRQIDRNGKRAVFAVDDNNKFLGVVTDGDIRKLILLEKSLDTALSAIIEGKKSYSFQYGSNYSEIVKKLPQNIKIIPLLNEHQEVVDYLEIDKLFHAPIASTTLSGNELANVIECVTSNWISSQGRFVAEFENNFANYIGVRHGAAVANGTVALHLALAALGIGPGDEVILPDLTFAATINAVLYVGATPVLVDIDEESWCIDPAMIEKAVTPKTRAIIPVHLFGQPCDMKIIMEIAGRHGIFVVEDSAQAHGAEFEGQKAGSFGTISCFSFFANKIITTGEGGMCLTNDPVLDKKMRILRDHGMRPEKRYWHDVLGYNYRMTNLQAAIGVAQVERVDEILRDREKVLRWYQIGLSDCKALKGQSTIENRKKVTWLVSFLIQDQLIDREHVIEQASKKNIVIRPFFYPLSSMPIYAPYASGNLKISSQIGKQGICLPTSAELTSDEYRFICSELKNILS